jgi:hypothetical protein
MSQPETDSGPLSDQGRQDPRKTTQVLASLRNDALSGKRAAAQARPVISDSWTRAMGYGVDPDNGSHTGVLSTDELEQRRQSSPLQEVLPALRDGLVSVADVAWHIMVVSDAEGRVLWRDGSNAIRKSADRVGFAEGASWAESAVGTNAIGTALVTRRPVQVHSAEHFVRAHHRWTCAAAPLHDPRDGRLLGAVNISGPATTVHPASLSLVTAVTRVAEGELRSLHWAAIEGLRSLAAPLLARVAGRAVVVDFNGWTAAVTGMPPLERVALPSTPAAGPAWLPSLGLCTMEPLPGGWLIRAGAGNRPEAPSRVVLDVSRPHDWSVTVSGAAGSWSHELSPRHAELLFILAVYRGGRTSAELALDLFGDAGRTVTVRAELSRLRRNFAAILAHRPYRFADPVSVDLLRPASPADLLPHSAAPAVRLARSVGPEA